MKRAVLGILVAASFACSSSDVNIARPQIDFVQLYAPTDLSYARGQDTMTAQFGFRITNQATEPITLKHVRLESVGDGGYVLRNEDRAFGRAIGVGQAIEDTLTARAYFQTSASGNASNEPVTVRATFYFDSPAGAFRKVVLRNIGQFSSGPR
ncbi:MAG: hypothetical protein ACXW2P_02615 [Thermoanaerobaculia bacterium]